MGLVKTSDLFKIMKILAEHEIGIDSLEIDGGDFIVISRDLTVIQALCTKLDGYADIRGAF